MLLKLVYCAVFCLTLNQLCLAESNVQRHRDGDLFDDIDIYPSKTCDGNVGLIVMGIRNIGILWLEVAFRAVVNTVLYIACVTSSKFLACTKAGLFDLAYLTKYLITKNALMIVSILSGTYGVVTTCVNKRNVDVLTLVLDKFVRQ